MATRKGITYTEDGEIVDDDGLVNDSYGDDLVEGMKATAAKIKARRLARRTAPTNNKARRLAARPTPAKGFTTKFLDNLKPADKRIELADNGKAGLRLRLEPSGTRTFVWYYKDGPKTRVLTLGRYGKGDGHISLKQARDQLDKAKERHREGERPGLVPDAPKTVEGLCEIFYKRRILRHRTRPEEVRRILDNDVIPGIGKKQLRTLTAPTVAAVVERVVDRGAETHAGKVLATLKQLFKFAEARGYIDRSPAYALDRKDLGVIDTIRDRHLDQSELKELWQAINRAPRMSEQTRYALKILILTGVRTGELLKARWEHIDLGKGEWFIPTENSKTTKWTVPLVPAVVRLFRELQDIAGESEWVLASTRRKDDEKDRPISDKSLNRALRRLFDLKVKDKDGNEYPLLNIPHVRVHDFRRTLRTQLEDLKAVDNETGRRYTIEPHVAEKCLNHSLGRIDKTYNKNTLFTKRREALQAWADRVDVIVNDRDNVNVLHTNRGQHEQT
jgi:integrase